METVHIIPAEDVFYLKSSLSAGLTILAERNLEVVTTEEFAMLYLSRLPVRVTLLAEGCNYDNKTGDLLIADRSHNPIFRNPPEAQVASGFHQRFYIDDVMWTELNDLAKTNPADAMQTGVLRVPHTLVSDVIAEDDILRHPLTLFLFRDSTPLYRERIRERGSRVVLNSHPLSSIASAEKPYCSAISMGSYGLPNVVHMTGRHDLRGNTVPLIGIAPRYHSL